MNSSTIRKTAAAALTGIMVLSLTSCSLFGSNKAVIEAAEGFADALVKHDAGKILKLTSEGEAEEFEALLDEDNYNPDKLEFVDAVCGTIEYKVDEGSVKASKDEASVDVEFTMADYGAVIDDGEYSDIDGLVDAIEDCDDTVDITITFEFEKDGDDWLISNIEDDDYLDLYEFYSADLGLIEGTYIAELDCNNALLASLGSDLVLEGNMIAEYELVLENGEYSITLDLESFKSNGETFFSNNMDAILMCLFSTEDPDELDEMAAMLGYADYDAMKDDMFDQMMDAFSDEELQVTASGTYIIDGDTIEFSDIELDDFAGTISDGKITIELDDVNGVFGSDKVTLAFEHV